MNRNTGSPLSKSTEVFRILLSHYNQQKGTVFVLNPKSATRDTVFRAIIESIYSDGEGTFTIKLRTSPAPRPTDQPYYEAPTVREFSREDDQGLPVSGGVDGPEVTVWPIPKTGE